ncbi:hypothetical protein BS50DRAFT_635702 [Corynespora cassiicola Philippines]|uniref:BTB domain-containing protein n=1 Tax=Corynespora cassiicola Philippines TaxID=1448308 RepID=A0A2T2NHE2_CORCC|nr:hypothetical protein BS50DRAFT_635702 [Corynespora cassiicola Philippines]
MATFTTVNMDILNVLPVNELIQPQKLLRGIEQRDLAPMSSGDPRGHLRSHGLHLLHTPLGRDFTIITASAVEYDVHASMLIGGPATLEHHAWGNPADTTNTRRVNPIETCIRLPDTAYFHPVIVSRIVNFLYTATYQVRDIAGPLTTLQHATHIPYAAPISTWTLNLSTALFHLHMIAAAEALAFPALRCVAVAKLADYLLRGGLVALPDLVAVIHGVFGRGRRKVVRDEDGKVGELVVVAVLKAEMWDWDKGGRAEAWVARETEGLGGFCGVYGRVRRESLEVVGSEEGKKRERNKARKKERKERKRKEREKEGWRFVLHEEGGEPMEM